MSQFVLVNDAPLSPGVLCSAREEPQSLGPAVDGASPIDFDRVPWPAGVTGRVRLRFSQPLTEPLVVSFSATLSEQPFPRMYQTTVPAGETELVWPRNRYAITGLRRIQTQAAPGGSVAVDALKWSAVVSRDGGSLLCGMYPSTMKSPAIPGRSAPLQLRGPVQAMAVGSIRADDALVAAGASGVRTRTPADVDADHAGIALEDAAGGSPVRVQLDIQPSP